jgi:hypothetical protein
MLKSKDPKVLGVNGRLPPERSPQIKGTQKDDFSSLQTTLSLQASKVGHSLYEMHRYCLNCGSEVLIQGILMTYLYLIKD